MTENTIQIIGCADHEGVSHVGGRIGAAKGPRALLSAAKKYKGSTLFSSALDRAIVFDWDCLLESKYNDVVREITQRPQEDILLIGGGHDFVYAHAKGLQKNWGDSFAILHLDPHLDMRSYDTQFSSGAPFRRMIDEGILTGKQVFPYGISRYSNSPELFEYALSKEVDIVDQATLLGPENLETWIALLETTTAQYDHVLISLDLDLFPAHVAPGVSATAAIGPSAETILHMLDLAYQYKQVQGLGIYELNPEYDIDSRTAKLAALFAYQFASRTPLLSHTL